MSTLRARCPDCRTLTAVAIGAEYQCHSCGREFGAGLVRVPRAWGVGGEAMAEAAAMSVPWPEAAAIDEATLAEQIEAQGRSLPARPLVLGGCCCSHVGAVRELARRHGRLAVVWLDAHGDLNTPESSPSGNAWGMPLRMLIDAGDVAAEDVTLLGARNLDPPEVAFIAAAGVRTELGDAPRARLRRARRRRRSTRRSSMSSCRSRTGCRSPSWRRCSPRCRGPSARASPGFLASARNEPTLARLGHALGL